jgi:hypothetical protein
MTTINIEITIPHLPHGPPHDASHRSPLLLGFLASIASSPLDLHRCPETVWLGIEPSASKEVLQCGRMQLPTNHATSIYLTVGWSDRVWGQQGSKFNAAGQG